MTKPTFRPGPWTPHAVDDGTSIILRQQSPTCRCPCGGTYHVMEQKGSEHQADWMVMHSLPVCEPFLDLDCGRYLEVVRLHHGVQRVE